MKQMISIAKDAAQSVVRAGGEHYHFNMACAEHGQAQVLDAMRNDILKTSEKSFEDAALQAAIEFRLMKQLESGQQRFKKIRKTIAANHPSPSVTATALGITT